MIRLAFLLSFMFTLPAHGFEWPVVANAAVPALLAGYGKPAPTATATATATVASAPTLVSAEITGLGSVMTLTFSTAVTSTVWPGAAANFLYSVDSGSYLGNGFVYASGDGTTTIVLSPTGTCPDVGQTVKLKYTRLPASTDVKDLSGNFLATFTDFTVTNNSSGCGD